MFNVGPFELIILAIVGIIVLGPDRIPGMAKDAARMIRTLRELANGARTQLRDELGPEFADVDLRNLNPRTALQRAILGDEDDWLASNPMKDIKDAMRFDRDDDEPVSMRKSPAEPAPTPPVLQKPAQRPLGRGEPAPYDTDAT